MIKKCVSVYPKYTNLIGRDLKRAVTLLKAGEIIGLPTETVYGLAGNGYDTAALAKIFAIKRRPYFDPLILHALNLESIQAFVQNIPNAAYQLAQTCWPGALTMVLPKKPWVPDLATASLSTVAVRVPSHPMMRQVLSSLDFPLAAPSANPFGYISPTTAEHVAEQLGKDIPYILDGGHCSLGIESTIIGFVDSKPIIYRTGSITEATIEAIVGPLIKRNPKALSLTLPQASGMLSNHYAPRKPLLMGDLNVLWNKYRGKRVGVLGFDRGIQGVVMPACQEILSIQGDLKEAARNLFGAMHRLDASSTDMILGLSVPNEGLGIAINDRLHRASTTSLF